MKRITCMTILVAALVVVGYGPTHTTAAADSVTVTGAALATFGQGAQLGSVSLSSLQLGTGVFIEPDGNATGVYSAVLKGQSLLGQSQQITINGKVLNGEVAPDGRVYLNGIARVDLGNGTPTISGVPFSVSTIGNSVTLAIDSTALPAAQLVGGNITIN
ncbi:MAG TPA: hypothetical protein VF251_09445 [Pyrinomonadaceae bacterium]